MKVLLEKISGYPSKNKAEVIVKKGESISDALDRASEKIGGRGAYIMFDNGVKGKVTVCKKSGSVIGEFWATADGELVSRATADKIASKIAKEISFTKIVANVVKASLKTAAPAPDFKVGDVYAGTWGYSMTLAKFAVITQVLPKSLRFDILENQTVSSADPNGFMPRVVPNMHRKKKTVTVRANVSSYGYIKVDGCLMKKWDGNPIQEDHLD